MTADLVWYASYGSNLSAARLQCYLSGGRPVGGMRTYPGARNPAPPSASRSLSLPGRIFFAGRSTTWGGGMAFYDPSVPGPSPARAYLVTVEQFADIAVQESDGEPHPDSVIERALLDPDVLMSDGASQQCGDGLYSRLLRVATFDGVPVLTFTAPHGAADVEQSPPSDAYVAMISTGLRESHGWADDAIADYFRALTPHSTR